MSKLKNVAPATNENENVVNVANDNLIEPNATMQPETPLTTEQILENATAKFAELQKQLRVCSDDEFETIFAQIGQTKTEIAKLKLQIENETERQKFAAAKNARFQMLPDLLQLAIDKNANPENAEIANKYNELFDVVAADWMAKYNTPPTTKTTKTATATATATVGDDGKISAKRADIIADYEKQIANGVTPENAIKNLYDKYKRSTVWFAVDAITHPEKYAK